MEFGILKEVTILFAVAIVIVFICSKIRLPAIIGFLFTGIVLGPHGIALLDSAHEIELLAEIGIIFLLFTIGIELSITELIRMKKPVFLGGGLQVGFSTLIVFIIAYLCSYSFGTSLVMGFLVSLSSTAIVLKIFQSNNSMDSPHGRLSLSLLIFQDLIIVPMVLIIPFLSGTSENSLTEVGSLLVNLALIVVFFFLARKVIPAVLRTIMIATHNKEILLFSILVICLGIAFVTSSVGLSLSLGAFLAGLLISESEYSTSSLEGVLPFRDVFTSLFFISVGMLFNLHFAVAHIGTLLLIALCMILIKIVATVISILCLRYPLRPAIIVGFSLAQVGEFSFILSKAALDVTLLTETQYQYFLGASILTMICTPFLIDWAPSFALWCNRFIDSKNIDDDEATITNELTDHLVIIGYGLGGKYLTQAARAVNIPYTIIEMNPETVRNLSKKGERVHYGDATQHTILENASLHKARVLAIVISDMIAVRRIVEIVHKEYPSVRIIARTRYLKEIEVLKSLGANEVIAEDFESSIEVFSNVLSKYYVPVNDIYDIIASIRKDYYDALRLDNIESVTTSSKELDVLQASHKVISVRVKPNSALCGVSIQESGLRAQYGINIIAIRRDESVLSNIDGTTLLQEGDIVYLFGDKVNLERNMQYFQG
ncbi:MAG: cation:proton antiporter [Desulfovibrionaceae bacterium]|nr:cation:proton antiporter [Desulfovibrionaceae bacterium]